MMKIVQLKSRYCLCVLLFFTLSSCKFNNIVSKEELKAYELKNDYLIKSFDFVLEDIDAQRWKSKEGKLFIVSAIKKNDSISVRIIPMFKKKHFLTSIPNNYTAYLIYNDIAVFYWGDAKLFFKSSKRKIDIDPFMFKEQILNKSKDEEGIVTIDNKEYFGFEFIIFENRLKLVQKNYYSTPFITE